MSILVTGGAGYVGSHMVLALLDSGENVIAIDDLSTGVRSLVPQSAKFIVGNIGDKKLVTDLLKREKITTVIHFAGSLIVPDSVENPLAYYKNNFCESRNLIEACIANGVRHFVFSSTAAVYGITGMDPVDETCITNPISPYGRSKLMIEWMLEDTARANGLNYVALRYFNVAGADLAGRSGPSMPNTTHLIKRACQTALGCWPTLSIFGTDYETPDGTCVRDYIHVSDLIDAHMLAINYLRAGGVSAIYNCGYGSGHSVLEVVSAVERVANCKLAVAYESRRAGDPALVVADSRRLKAIGWKPKTENLDEMVRSAYLWERHLVESHEF